VPLLWKKGKNAERKELLGLEPVSLVTRKDRLRWFGHVECKDDTDWIKHYNDGDRSETEWTWWVSIWLMISGINMMTNMPKYSNIFRFVLKLNKIRQKLAHPGLTVDFSWVAFKHSWPCPWPWIRSYGIPSCITHWALSTYQISLKSEKLFCGRTICRDTSKFKVTWHKK